MYTLTPKVAVPARLLAFALIGAACIVTPHRLPASTADPGIVRTKDGPLQGTLLSGGRRFLGIPYAQPPVAHLRWRAPQRVTPWTALRTATQFASHCPQNAGLGGFSASSDTEDCLYLNVFTPSGPTARLPVMAWIPGGGLHSGESDDYDGQAMAEQGHVIVVTLNYRVGILGFFALPALRHVVPAADFGLLDQQAALRWIQRNISAFGGDPENVTLFGESAGADSVIAQLVAHGSDGLFRRAIIASSAYSVKTTSLDEAMTNADAFARASGCRVTDTICLRHLPVTAILKLQGRFLSPMIIDGAVVPEDLADAVRAGRFKHVPILNGTNREEYRFYQALSMQAPHGNELLRSVVDGLKKKYPTVDSLIAANYAGPAMSAEEATTLALTDAIFACPARAFDRWASRYSPVFAYEFADLDAPWYIKAAEYRIGAGHTSELQYIFPGFHGASGTPSPLSGSQQALSNSMIRAWSDFATRGVPTVPGQVPWKPYENAADNIEVFSPAETATSHEFASVHRCAVWD
jgi:para-nitrobenzyl esterase